MLDAVSGSVVKNPGQFFPDKLFSIVGTCGTDEQVVSYAMDDRVYSIIPIGTIRTPFDSKYAAPRQPGTAGRKVIGTITLERGKNFEQALEDLSGFEYIWILFWFDRNKNWKPKVLPPATERKKRGVFATRSPHRPNPIGLSLCRLIGVKGRTLKIENPDLLDATPILDIKPYIPHTESKPDARSGWITDTHQQVQKPFTVTIARNVLRSIRESRQEGSSQLISYLRNTLKRDPFPHAYRRIVTDSGGRMRIAVQRWRFSYTIKNTSVRVERGWSV